MRLLLDTAVLGEICHPRKFADTRVWAIQAAKRHELLVSEIVDYELRRKLLHIGAQQSLSRLDELGRELEYAPVTTAHWRAAAQLWASARKAGRSGGPPERLEADALIAAQALSHGAVVVTPNARHFAGIVEARHWREIAAD